MQSEGDSLTGLTIGIINSPDAIRTRAETLKSKLMLHQGKLVGRHLATAGDPDRKNVMLPFVLTLNRG